MVNYTAHSTKSRIFVHLQTRHQLLAHDTGAGAKVLAPDQRGGSGKGEGKENVPVGGACSCVTSVAGPGQVIRLESLTSAKVPRVVHKAL